MEEIAVPLFAYGSLLNLQSFELTLGRKYKRPRPICVVPGWRRSWDAAMPNEGFYEDTADGPLTPERIIYANVRRSGEANVNGVLYFLNEADFEVFDRREWTYDRIIVDWTARDFGPSSGKAYIYVSKPEWISTAAKPRSWAAIRKTYLDAIDQGVAALGDSFKADYMQSTDPVSSELILRDKSMGDVFEI